jgi:hypothetical protein
MDEKTQEHMALAQRNQRFADTLRFLDPATAAQNQEHAVQFLWSVVVSFYGAVHFVNAYMWEHGGFAPRNHSEREQYLYANRKLAPIVMSYEKLQDRGFQARYDPRARISADDAQQALDELHLIAELVNRELGAS